MRIKQVITVVYSTFMLFAMTSCTTTVDQSSDGEDTGIYPSIEILNIVASASSVSFTVIPSDAVEYQYSVAAVGDEPSYVTVMGSKESEIKVSNLEQGVEYEILAFASGVNLESSEVVSASFFTEAVVSYPRTSLAYKFTATWCTYCPYMTESLTSIEEAGVYPLAIVAIHNETEASKDYNCTGGKSLISEWNVNSLPTTMIDYRESCSYSSDVLTGALSRSNGYQCTANIAISSSIEGDKATINVSTTFGATARYKIAVVVTENNISEPNTDGSADGLYHHVSRIFLTDALGDALGSMALSEEVTKTYECELSDSWNRDELEITAIILKEEKTNCYYANNVAVAAMGSSVEYK